MGSLEATANLFNTLSRLPMKAYGYYYLLLLITWSCSQTTDTTFYISPEGQAGNPGTKARPFPTLESAQQAIRSISDTNQQVTVYMREGIYRLESTLNFTKEDGGSVNAPVTWKAFPGESAILTGGIKLEGFTPLNNPDARARINPDFHDDIYQIDLSDFNIADYGDLDPRSGNRMELYYNGAFMQIARYPNEDWLTIASVPQSGDQSYVREPKRIRYGLPVGKHFGRFTYDTDRPNFWQKDDNIWMQGYWVWDWSDEYQRIDSIDKAKKEIYPAKPYHRYGYHQRQRFYFLNVLEELDQPSEWYLDRNTDMLYFWPPDQMSAAEIWLSVLDKPMLHLQNASHIVFEQLDFRASRAESMVIEGGSEVLVGGCTFTNMGKTPVVVKGGTHHRVKGCDMYELAMGGISLQGGDRKTLTPSEHIAQNNHIHHFARRVKTYQPALDVSGVGNKLLHNLLHDAPHMAIGFGGNEHLIAFNEVYQVLTETSDAGAIYNGRDWTERGTVIRNNYFHDLGATISGEGFHGVMGVYLDDCLPGTTISGNIFQNIDRGIMLGGGQYNTAENNLFINCNIAIHVDARANGWARENALEGGPWHMYEKLAEVPYQQEPWRSTYPELVTITENPSDPIGVVIKNNISQGTLWLDMKEGTDFELINITDNIVADEQLVRMEKRNVDEAQIWMRTDKQAVELLTQHQNHVFTPEEISLDITNGTVQLPAQSILEKIDFNPIPIDSIGLQIDTYRAALPISSEASVSLVRP